MNPRRLGVLVLLAALGVGAGFGAGAVVAGQDPTRIDEAGPVSASPSVPEPTPSGTTAPYSPDIDYTQLVPPTEFTRYRISNDLQTWSYLAPEGWVAHDVTTDAQIPKRQIQDRGEVRFRPADEPSEGGYSLRVKVVDDHVPPSTMLANKLDALQDLADVVVLDQTEDSLYFTYRDGNNKLRYNFFRWFAAPGVTEATLEMSIAGRQVDDLGMRGLLEQFKGGLRPIG